MRTPTTPPRTELRDALDEALSHVGSSFATLVRRLLVLAVAVIVGWFLGAVFRAVGLPELNLAFPVIYAALAGAVVVNPAHVFVVLAGGAGVAAVRGPRHVLPAGVEYVRLVARLLALGSLPHFFMAVAGGDSSLGGSFSIFGWALVAIGLAFATKRRLRLLHRLLSPTVPAILFALSVANAVVPAQFLAAVGVPASLRIKTEAERELAELEEAQVGRRDAELAACLAQARSHIEMGMMPTPQDARCQRKATENRFTLPGWVEEQVDAYYAARQAEEDARRDAAIREQNARAAAAAAQRKAELDRQRESEEQQRAAERRAQQQAEAEQQRLAAWAAAQRRYQRGVADAAAAYQEAVQRATVTRRRIVEGTVVDEQGNRVFPTGPRTQMSYFDAKIARDYGEQWYIDAVARYDRTQQSAVRRAEDALEQARRRYCTALCPE